jgi:hypothetical protein
MAFVEDKINVAVASDETAGTSIANTLTFTVNVGEFCVISIATDNISTVDGNTNNITSVQDSQSNAWTKAYEQTNTIGGAAADGATVAIFYSVITTQLTNTDTITVNFSDTITCSTYIVSSFTIAAGNTVSIAGTIQVLNNDNSDAGSMTLSGLTSKEYLFWRPIASETDGYGLTKTTNYTEIGPNRSGSGGSEKGHVNIDGEYRILTGTGDSSNPTMTDTSADRASLYIAFQEVSSGPAVYVPRHGFIHLGNTALA